MKAAIHLSKSSNHSSWRGGKALSGSDNAKTFIMFEQYPSLTVGMLMGEKQPLIFARAFRIIHKDFRGCTIESIGFVDKWNEGMKIFATLN